MVYGLWFMVYGLWFMIYGLGFMVYGLWFMIYGLWFMVYDFFSLRDFKMNRFKRNFRKSCVVIFTETSFCAPPK